MDMGIDMGNKTYQSSFGMVNLWLIPTMVTIYIASGAQKELVLDMHYL